MVYMKTRGKLLKHDHKRVGNNVIQNIDRCQVFQDVSRAHESHQITIRELSEEYSIGYGSVQPILTVDLARDLCLPNLNRNCSRKIKKRRPNFTCYPSP
ncbi:hypothetical protein AVEN_113367-1 [Araneus ventricosus]|uniref:Uncharacterized protein n=1 Tax=Araneus ventricosus TaxID=182803 RepID=A0A4Y2IQ07_ARAVE|nr:hypothetical protein AVEN_113367-1 [Araneus ventricosus]